MAILYKTRKHFFKKESGFDFEAVFEIVIFLAIIEYQLNFKFVKINKKLTIKGNENP